MDEQYTVMIVDDNSEDRYSLKRHLKNTNLALIILEVESGLEGIDLLTTPVNKLKSQYPGISAPVTLFLDINMPLMNGWEFIEQLEQRRHEIELNPTVVMMYSSSDSTQDKRKSESYEAVANYIVKGDHTPQSLKQTILDNNR